MAVTIQLPSQQTVNTTDAIEKRRAQEKYVRDTLTSAMSEVRKAEAEGRPAGRPVSELMNELVRTIARKPDDWWK